MADEQPESVTSAATEPAGGERATEMAERVAALERQVAELQAQVERERDQATDYMRHWHTAQADFANFKRRAQQEQEQRDRLLAAQALAPALNALDSLERAFLALPPTLRGYTWIEGIALVELQLRRALEMQGISVIEAEPGQAFDPARHEPIGEVESGEYPEGAIVVVAQRGYHTQGLLIRPALVQLARKPAPAAEPAAATAASASADGDAPDASAPAEAPTDATTDATEASPGT